jgi:ABC-type multidrug transport system fused ATPase/permease subunit
VLILMRALSGGQDLQSQYNLARQRLPFVDKVRSLISDLERDRAPAGICSLAEVEDIELRDVHFSYVQSRPVLTGASAAIRPGELVAIVGPSGAGKSTLLQILLRLRYPDGGQYLIGRQPASSFLDADWARRVACVPQDSRVLHASVADNIRFFRDIPEGQVLAAARAAQIDHDILALPEGYETLIGQRMDALSGGQRQRLCLARALAGQPQLLILDEPTSALDDASERLVHEALAQLRGRVTTIVVAHRPGILSVCDRVLTLDGGTLHARPHVPTAFATMAPDGAIL